MTRYVIPDVFREITASVQTEVLAALQAYDSKITGVHFYHGSVAEISETMQQMDGDPSQAKLKYPAVFLIEDIEADRRGTAYDCEIRPRIIIAHHTDQTLKSAAREGYTFERVLRPIYEQLMEEIGWHMAFVEQEVIGHRAIERKSWGRQFGSKENAPNRFSDYIDAIELLDVALTVDYPPLFQPN